MKSKFIFKPIDLIYIALLALGFYLFNFIFPDLDQISQTLFIVAIIVLIIFAYISRYHQLSITFLSEFAKKHNFKSDKVKISEIVNQKEFDLFNTQCKPDITDYYTTGKDSYYYYAWPADLGPYEGSGEKGERWSIPVWFFVFDLKLDKEIPNVSVFNQKDLRKFKVIHRLPSVTFESNQFNARYHVYAANLNQAYEVLDPLIMNILIDEKNDLSMEISGNRLLIYRCGKADSVEFIEQMYQFGRKIAERLNR